MSEASALRFRGADCECPPLRFEDRAGVREHFRASRAFRPDGPAPTSRTKASSSVSLEARNSAMDPCITSRPSWMMATVSQSRSTTSSTCEVRKTVTPWRTWSSEQVLHHARAHGVHALERLVEQEAGPGGG